MNATAGRTLSAASATLGSRSWGAVGVVALRGKGRGALRGAGGGEWGAGAAAAGWGGAGGGGGPAGHRPGRFADRPARHQGFPSMRSSAWQGVREMRILVGGISHE